jgi:hypothetical protein
MRRKPTISSLISYKKNAFTQKNNYSKCELELAPALGVVYTSDSAVI